MKTAFGLDVPQNLGDILQPSRCGLIVYDMQEGIVAQLADGKQIVERCAQLLDSAREVGMRVFFLRHFFLPSAAAGVGQLRRAMVWQRKEDPQETTCFIPQNSPQFEIVDELKPREGEVVIDKITMSGFESTYLNLAMRDAQLSAFVIAGIALEIGIEPTIRHGLDLNYLPVLVSDACGARTAELKERSLATLAETGEVFETTTIEVIKLLKGQ